MAEVSESSGLAVTVRKGKVETIEQTRDRGLGISVHVGKRRGHASTSDFSPQALARTVQAAYDIAAITGEDPYAGLPEKKFLALGEHDVSGLKLFSPWHVSVDEAIELAREIEAASFAVSSGIANSDGASVSVGHGHFLSANSRGFRGDSRTAGIPCRWGPLPAGAGTCSAMAGIRRRALRPIWPTPWRWADMQRNVRFHGWVRAS